MWHFIYCYAECHYAECRYAECRGAINIGEPRNNEIDRTIYASANCTYKICMELIMMTKSKEPTFNFHWSITSRLNKKDQVCTLESG